MRVVDTGDKATFLVRMSARELSELMGREVPVETGGGWSGPHHTSVSRSLVGKEFDTKGLAEAIKLATAVKYKAKQSIAAIAELKSYLETATFPFLDGPPEQEVASVPKE